MIKETGCNEVNLRESSRQDSIVGFCGHEEDDGMEFIRAI
jgi:hypothetical protein